MGSVLAALVLFFLPWVDLRCSGDRMMSQSGVQMIYGGASLPPAVRGLMEQEEASKRDSDEIGIGWLVALAAMATGTATAWAISDMRRPAFGVADIVGNCCAVGLALLLIQAAIGFPLEDAVVRMVASPAEPAGSGQPFPTPDAPWAKQFEKAKRDTEKGFAAGIAMAFQIETRTWFYLELIALGIPAALRFRTFLTPKSDPPRGAYLTPVAPRPGVVVRRK